VLGAFAAGAHPQAQHVAFAVAVDAHSNVDRPVGDLTVPDLHMQSVDEHDRVDGVEWAGLPCRQFLGDSVGHPGDQITRDIHVIDLRQMGPDLSGGQALGIKTDDGLVEAGDTAGVLRNDLGFELTGPVSRDLQRNGTDLGQDRLG
jgi:hypothetical protein